jgi:hypothetical protein
MASVYEFCVYHRMETRIIVSLAIVFHGIIHMVGFMKEWKLGPIGIFSGKTIVQFSESTLRFVGLVWLLACFVLLASAVTYYMDKDWYWIAATTGLIVSQTLIVLYWRDAKWGTLLNVILLCFIVFAFGQFHFSKRVSKEVNDLVAASSPGREVITEAKAAALPHPVQTWLRKSNVIGKPIPKSVHLFQKGTLRMDQKSKWQPFEAEQYFTIKPPGFVWDATIHSDKLIDVRGRDKYERGRGNMLIKAASLIPIANASGKEIDQGTLVRYMAEIIWFPQAVVSDNITWQAVDSTHAIATMSYNNVTASGTYTFDRNGLPVGFEAKRFGLFDGKYAKETWSVTTSRHEFVDGVPIGKDSKVTWKLKTGEFDWLRLVVVDIEFRY